MFDEIFHVQDVSHVLRDALAVLHSYPSPFVDEEPEDPTPVLQPVPKVHHFHPEGIQGGE